MSKILPRGWEIESKRRQTLENKIISSSSSCLPIRGNPGAPLSQANQSSRASPLHQLGFTTLTIVSAADPPVTASILPGRLDYIYSCIQALSAEQPPVWSSAVGRRFASHRENLHASFLFCSHRKLDLDMVAVCSTSDMREWMSLNYPEIQKWKFTLLECLLL